MHRRILVLAALAALALAALPVGTASAKSCGDLSVSGGYLTNITVKRTSCSKGQAVARAHRKKRLDNGGKDGKFNGRVKGFKCRETARNESGEELVGRVACKRGRKRVKFIFSQRL